MADTEAIATDIVDCAIKVHKTLGPGLLESAYQHCHAYELRKRGWDVEIEVKLPMVYEDQKIDAGYRIDTFINTSTPMAVPRPARPANPSPWARPMALSPRPAAPATPSPVGIPRHRAARR